MAGNPRPGRGAMPRGAGGFRGELTRRSAILWNGLEKVAKDFPTVFEDVRGAGLLLGLKCMLPQGEVQAACVAEGLLAITAGDNVLRIAPPLVVTDEDIAEGLTMLRRAAQHCGDASRKAAAA